MMTPKYYILSVLDGTADKLIDDFDQWAQDFVYAIYFNHDKDGLGIEWTQEWCKRYRDLLNKEVKEYEKEGEGFIASEMDPNYEDVEYIRNNYLDKIGSIYNAAFSALMDRNEYNLLLKKKNNG